MSGCDGPLSITTRAPARGWPLVSTTRPLTLPVALLGTLAKLDPTFLAPFIKVGEYLRCNPGCAVGVRTAVGVEAHDSPLAVLRDPDGAARLSAKAVVRVINDVRSRLGALASMV